MRTYTLNIGLENNPLDRFEIEMLLQNSLPKGTNINTRKNIGEWNGKPERTLVVQFSSELKRAEVLKIVRGFTVKMTQEAIPVKDEEAGVLVYRPDFTGEKYKFDPEFFIDF